MACTCSAVRVQRCTEVTRGGIRRRLTRQLALRVDARLLAHSLESSDPIRPSLRPHLADCPLLKSILKDAERLSKVRWLVDMLHAANPIVAHRAPRRLERLPSQELLCSEQLLNHLMNLICGCVAKLRALSPLEGTGTGGESTINVHDASCLPSPSLLCASPVLTASDLAGFDGCDCRLDSRALASRGASWSLSASATDGACQPAPVPCRALSQWRS